MIGGESGEMLARNLEALKVHQPALHARFLAWQDEGTAVGAEPAEEAAPPHEDADGEVRAGRAGHPVLVLRTPELERTVHSRYEPASEAEQLVARELAVGEVSLVVLLGVELGYLADALMPRLDRFCRGVVVEPSWSLFALALTTRDLTAAFAHPWLRWSVGDAPTLAGEHVAACVDYKVYRRLRLVAHPAVLAMRHAVLAPVTQAIQERVFQGRVRHNTIAGERMGWSFRNALRNLPALAESPSVGVLNGCWAGKPAVLVASGPSLAQHAELLREVQDRVLLAAAGTAFRVLGHQGIQPHLTVALDGLESYSKYFEDHPRGEGMLVFDAGVGPGIPELFSGRRFGSHSLADMAHFCDPLVGPRAVLPSGGSVAHSVFMLLLAMGADPIILVGQDLAYAGTDSHAPGYAVARGADAPPAAAKPSRFEVPGYHDSPVETDAVLNSYRLWFEDILRRLRGRTVINATEGGARIAGTIQRSLREVLDEYAPPGTVLDLAPIAEAQGDPLPARAEVRARLESLVTDLEAMVVRCGVAMAAAEALLDAGPDSAHSAALRKALAEAEAEVQALQGPARSLVDGRMQDALFVVERVVGLEGIRQEAELCKVLLELYRRTRQEAEAGLAEVRATLEAFG